MDNIIKNRHIDGITLSYLKELDQLKQGKDIELRNHIRKLIDEKENKIAVN